MMINNIKIFNSNQRKKILWLFYNTHDNRDHIIAKEIGTSPQKIARYLAWHLDRVEEFIIRKQNAKERSRKIIEDQAKDIDFEGIQNRISGKEKKMYLAWEDPIIETFESRINNPENFTE